MASMKRRDVLRLLALSSATGLCGCAGFPFPHPFKNYSNSAEDEKTQELSGQDIGEIHGEAQSQSKTLAPGELTDEMLQDVRARSIFFEQDFPNDILFSGEKFAMIKLLTQKFRAVQRHVGNGNFNVVGMDEFFRLADLSRPQKLFLDEIFSYDAKNYGFMGSRVSLNFSDTINKHSVSKIPYTGHYLRKGLAQETYKRITKDIGPSVTLTSGVRGIAKQYHLFFEKALETGGNMSKASRSLAPPGYSFHGQGDFDIGRKGYGFKNFTSDFAQTDEFKKLLDLGYIEVRYTESNLLGVRFEPWHIKVQA